MLLSGSFSLEVFRRFCFFLMLFKFHNYVYDRAFVDLFNQVVNILFILEVYFVQLKNNFCYFLDNFMYSFSLFFLSGNVNFPILALLDNLCYFFFSPFQFPIFLFLFSFLGQFPPIFSKHYYQILIFANMCLISESFCLFFSSLLFLFWGFMNVSEDVK